MRVPTREQGYSAKETKLIQELVKARLEQKAELQHENLDGYELPPRTQFSMACIHLFEGVQYILPIINRQKKRIAVVTCQEEEGDSVEWARLKQGAWVNKDITSIEVLEKIFAFMGWDRLCRYKAMGRVATSDIGLILVFELDEAIMFAAKPIEYEDPETGKIRKKDIKYYPDKYKDHIGRSYNDYAALRQTSLFEDLNDYGSNDGTVLGV